MLSRPLLIAVLASPLFVPVTCTSVMLPVAHGLSHARVHDVAAGEPLYVRDVSLPLVDRLNPNPALAVAIDIDELPAALERWPGLTPRLPPAGNTAGPGSDRLYWRVLDDTPDGQLVELLHDGADVEHTVRYRATDAGVTLLTSRRFSDAESWPGFAVGLVAGLGLMFAMRGVRGRAGRVD